MKSDVEISGRRLQVTRTFQAPRAQVFGWWANAEKLQQWSRCKEAIACEVQMDFRVGGSFTQTMRLMVHGQECEHRVTGVYLEIVAPEKIVYQGDFGFFTARVTVEFFEQGDQTRVMLTNDGCSDEFMRGNVSKGTSESFDILEAALSVAV
jgi:uncharacterized protein YndB with AHSA1/START domain